jgi:hypothetical protein
MLFKGIDIWIVGWGEGVLWMCIRLLGRRWIGFVALRSISIEGWIGRMIGRGGNS